MNNSSLNLQSNQVQNAQYVTHQKTPKNQSQPTFNGNEPKQDGDKKLRTALIGLGIAGAAAAGIAIAVKTGKAGKIINACKDKVDDVAGSVSKKAGQAAESATTATTKAANAASKTAETTANAVSKTAEAATKTAETAAKAAADKVDDVQTIAQRLNLKTENLPKIENGKIGDITMKNGKLFNADGKIFEGSITGKMKNGDVLELTSDGTGKICASKRLNLETGDGFVKFTYKNLSFSASRQYNIKSGKFVSEDFSKFTVMPKEADGELLETQKFVKVVREHGTKPNYEKLNKLDIGISVPSFEDGNGTSYEVQLNKKFLPSSLVIKAKKGVASKEDLKFEKGIAMKDGKPFSGCQVYTEKNGDIIKVKYDEGKWRKSNIQKANGEFVLKERIFDKVFYEPTWVNTYRVDKNLDPISWQRINILDDGRPLTIENIKYVPRDDNKVNGLFDSSKVKAVLVSKKEFDYDDVINLNK